MSNKRKKEEAENKMPYPIYTFDPVIYPMKLYVVIGATAENLKERFGEVEEDEENVIASVLQVEDLFTGGNVILMRFRDVFDMDYDTVTHESLHAAFEMLGYVGVKLDYENQEPVTYLAGWVAKCLGNIAKGTVKPDTEEPNKMKERN